MNHDGDVAVGERLVEAAAGAGADAVKFQLFRAGLLLSDQAGLVDYQKESAGNADDLLGPLELSPEKMVLLIRKAQGLGMAAVVTPFSVELVGACVAMGVDAIKLASPDLVNRPLVEEAARTGLPLIVSTGAAELGEVERTVGWLGAAVERTVILHCVSAYPTVANCAALGGIVALRNVYSHVAIGYSDHTVETMTGALAVSAGACLLEKHLTLDRKRKGPDHAASLEPLEFTEYARLARMAYAMRGPMVKEVQGIERGVRLQTRQSVVAVRAIAAGTVLTREMLTVKRPGTGIPAAMLEETVGKRTRRAVAGNAVVMPEDLEGG